MRDKDWEHEDSIECCGALEQRPRDNYHFTNPPILHNVHLHDEGPDCVILGQPFLHQARFEHFWENDVPSVWFTTPKGSIEFPYLGPQKSKQEKLSERIPTVNLREDEIRNEQVLSNRWDEYTDQDFKE